MASAQYNVPFRRFLNIPSFGLTEQQELYLAQIAIKMIEADDKIEYSEICFFKKRFLTFI